MKLLLITGKIFALTVWARVRGRRRAASSTASLSKLEQRWLVRPVQRTLTGERSRTEELDMMFDVLTAAERLVAALCCLLSTVQA